ncbi:hypothetical protein V496_06663 [Pseudogymnoascus sp. VKM F-4515 (FW-2607)]|nr:hypothetical protein V496_06663 [Pseudogymnoascus sp. VKM F-4515 (FW-2607)]KFY77034.1 hypothetical protein V498_09443 [Pseudogymnoascus sp. VKM F-4517 (FW-2822)]
MSSTTGTMRGTPSRSGAARGAMPQFTNSPSSSGIPRPLDNHGSSTLQSEAGGSSVSTSRQKQSKRDEAIRRKIETDLSKKTKTTGRARQSKRAPPGTVMALRPSQALQIKPNTTVAEAAQLMAAKREDCVLVTDDDDRIAGIFTAKDLAYRVVGAGIKANSITIAEIMTKNPLCARTDTSATDALDLMVRKGFRHLPVMDENQDISGILDITKCFYDAMEKLERAYSSSRKLYDALEGVQSELGSSQPQQIIQYVEALRLKMSGPTLESVLDGRPPTTVSVRTSVKEAAILMKENHTTAVLVQDQGAITGIFTSKDVVLRVIAPGMDPANCSVVRVMTPHPDFAPMEMTIQAALRKMHDGHYLNLPVMNDGGEIVGMVDVLKLTYATLEQINTISTGDSEGPAWNKFWLSLDNDTESMMSGEGSHHQVASRSLMSPDHSKHGGMMDTSVAPGDSASHTGAESPVRHLEEPAVPVEDIPFPFKFKAPSGRVHRLHITASNGLAELIALVTAKLGAEVDAVGGAATFEDGKLGVSGFALSYLDDEGDTVSITTDHDLKEAIVIARQGGRDKVDLFVHDPEKPAITATVEPVPVIAELPTPPMSTIRRRRERVISEEDEEESDEEDHHRLHSRSRRQQPVVQEAPQIIAGVPNDLLLPGAIVTLAVAIIGVFAITKATSSLVAYHTLEISKVAPTTTTKLPRTIKPATMIIRNVASRHGRGALSSSIRTLTTSAAPPPQIHLTPDSVSPTAGKDFQAMNHIKRATGSLGSDIAPFYQPHRAITAPLGPDDITLPLLLASQSHMGHATALWHPGNQRYIHGIRAGIHIISLEATAVHLRRAAKVVEGVAYHGGTILFVGTRKGQQRAIVGAANLAGGCHLFDRWVPGSLTNGDQILGRAGIKVVDERDEVIDNETIRKKLEDHRAVKPDLVVVLNPLENYICLHECGLAGVPTIGVVDTDCNPTWVTYPIPANDDSLRCTHLIAGVLGRAGQIGQKKRADAAKKGEVPWETAEYITEWFKTDMEVQTEAKKKAMELQ